MMRQSNFPKTISQRAFLIDVPIHYYFHVNFTAHPTMCEYTQKLKTIIHTPLNSILMHSLQNLFLWCLSFCTSIRHNVLFGVLPDHQGTTNVYIQRPNYPKLWYLDTVIKQVDYFNRNTLPFIAIRERENVHMQNKNTGKGLQICCFNLVSNFDAIKTLFRVCPNTSVFDVNQ